MPDMTLDQAIERLRGRGGYEWLIDGPESWYAADVAEQLTKRGITVSRDTVVRWFKLMPHTQDFGKLGHSASRADLLLFFAGRMIGGGGGRPAGRE